MNEQEFHPGSVPVAVVARIYGKDASWVRAGIVSGWLPIGKATRNGNLVTSMIIQTYGLLPGYHMNKKHWITILLDGSVSEAKTLDFLDMSYDLIDGADRKEEK